MGKRGKKMAALINTIISKTYSTCPGVFVVVLGLALQARILTTLPGWYVS